MRKIPIAALLLLSACVPAGTDWSADRPPGPDGDYRLAEDMRVLEGRETQAAYVRSGRLTLPQLIDIAQTNNPTTRAAWLRARQAAEAEGLVETTYLPRINASIIAGAAHMSTDAYTDPAGLLPDGSLSIGTDNVMAAVTAYWLLFDFGKRAAARKEAHELSFAANVNFSGAHQALIHNVTQAYHDLHAAKRREAVHMRRLANARTLAESTRAKREQGISTVTDVATAEQAVAQAKFDLSRARSETRAVETALMAHLGLPAGRRVQVSFSNSVKLPRSVPAQLETQIEHALARRPDLQAAFARARASEAHIAAVEAEFHPRIYAAAALGYSLGGATFDDSRRPGSLSASLDGRPVASVFVGVTIPLWDAGAKERRLRIAQDQHAAAQAEAESLRLLAESEIVGAYELLKSSLEANRAATQLVSTTKVSYDAALGFAEQGLAAVSEVVLARQLLFDAEIAQIEAQHAALAAAATLAFASGQLG